MAPRAPLLTDVDLKKEYEAEEEDSSSSFCVEIADSVYFAVVVGTIKESRPTNRRATSAVRTLVANMIDGKRIVVSRLVFSRAV